MRALAGGVIVNARDHSVDALVGGERFDMRWTRNTSMERPVPRIVMNVPSIDFTHEFGNPPKHVSTGRDRSFDLQKNPAPLKIILVVHP